MADTSAKTFPGVYTQIIDQSFLPPQTSRYRPGLVGVTSKGPFDTPTVVRSLKEFLQVFGTPIVGEVNTDGTPLGNGGFYLADAVAMISDFTNQMTIVRVGNRYTDLALHDGSGTAGSYVLGVSPTNASAVFGLLAEEPVGDVFLRISQLGLPSTVNAKVDTAGGGTISLLTTTDALQADYTAGTVSYSKYDGAANNAEGVLYAYSYGSNSTQVTDLALTTFGTITGNKNAYQFTVQSNPLSLVVGGLYKIKVPNNAFKAQTPEIRVKQVINNTAYLETSDVTRVGYQAVPLQDTYTINAPAYLYRATGHVPFLYLQGKTAGEWANGANSTQGLYTRVRPGSAPGTKKIEVFENGGLVETHDNLSHDSTSNDYYVTRLAASQYIQVTYVNPDEAYHAANTVAPWDVVYYGSTATSPLAMPAGALNAGILVYAGTTYETGAQYTLGYNGANVQEIDFIGQYDPVNDTLSGLKVFEDADNVDVNIIACPMNLSAFGGGTDAMSGVATMQEMARIAKKINAIALADVPPNLNAHDAVDWHNGAGQFESRPRIDDPNIAVYWNWFFITDRFTGLSKLVPPTLGTLRCMGFTFQRDKPWYAAAGETRGWIPECNSVQYERVLIDTRHAMYGAGNSVNPILKIRGRHFLYGERTMQRAESKLTAVHSVILVNYVVSGLAEIGRRFVFDPNDLELLVHIRLAFSEFLDKVRNERGIEEYELVVDDRNNTADTRNRREVIVDLAIIPTDVAERIFINATVRESGAQLNTVNA